MFLCYGKTKKNSSQVLYPDNLSSKLEGVEENLDKIRKKK
jgi:hypothetical protein